MPKQPEKAIELSENVVLAVLAGKKTVHAHKQDYAITKEMIELATKIYAKRIPMMTEEVGSTSKQTIIQILKDHVPKEVETNVITDITDRTPELT